MVHIGFKISEMIRAKMEILFKFPNRFGSMVKKNL